MRRHRFRLLRRWFATRGSAVDLNDVGVLRRLFFEPAAGPSDAGAHGRRTARYDGERGKVMSSG
jgi:hypothetical protein